jgi:hypothetical protein
MRSDDAAVASLDTGTPGDTSLPPLTPQQLGIALASSGVWRQGRSPSGLSKPSGGDDARRELRRTELLPDGSFASQTLTLPDSTLTLRVVLVPQPDGSIAIRELFNAEEGTTATFEPPLLWVPGVLAQTWQASSGVTLSGGVLARGVGEAQVSGDASMVVDAPTPDGMPRAESTRRLVVRIALRLLVGSVQVDRQTSLVLTLSENTWDRVLEERTLAVRALGVRVRSERSAWEPVADEVK